MNNLIIGLMNLKLSYLLYLSIWIYVPVLAQSSQNDWEPSLTETWAPVPEKVFHDSDNNIPIDAIILFDGNSLREWGPTNWYVEDNLLIVKPGTGGITSRDSFGDIQLHLEWKIPEDVEGESQRRGNSGVFLQGLYEVQILDSYKNATYTNGQAGAIYKQYAPLVNASLPAGHWQSYDIYFEAPVFRDDGKLLKPAYITVMHNGVFVQHRVEIKGQTIFTGLPAYEKHANRLPIYIQGSHHSLAFRNIWVRNL